MRINGTEVLLRFLGCACSQALVVFDFEPLSVLCGFLPCLIFDHRVKAMLRLPFRCLHNRCEEFFDEPWQLCKRWPPRVDEVDQQTLDVRTVSILICHDHNRTVAKPLQFGIVLLVEVQAHDLDEVLNLIVAHHLLQGGVTHIEDFSLQRKNAVAVTAHNAEACHSERFRRVTLSENQGTLSGRLASSIVCILKLGNASDPIHPSRVRLELLSEIHLAFRHGSHENKVNDTALGNLAHELLGKFATGAKFGLLGRQRFLGLGVEGWIFNQRLDEDPKVTPHVVRANVAATLLLLLARGFRLLEDGFDDLISHMRHVRASTDSGNGVGKAHLLEAALREAETHFPTI
mmetsp:Transcript_26793/g.70404  ORF Transcript_26793/g.70404 Transcript_26793/m.70404 type:complete len:346 (-) Transcript_26793:921-1958(-)